MGPRTVLVIEDDVHIRALLRAILAGRGYEVIEAADGWAGIARARAQRPDAILLDLGLPYMDGLDVLDALKDDDDTWPIPVIVVTANGRASMAGTALDAGAHDFVRKPFDNEELCARVDAAVRAKMRHEALQDEKSELERQATIDELTGLPNRRSLDAELRRQIARAERSGRRFSVVMVDIDRFKTINDHHGHSVGDEALRRVAGRLSSRVRRGDIVGRWGGEEFLVIAPETDAAGASVLAESLRLALCAEAMPIADGVTVDLSASFGVAVWERETAESLVNRADAALYDAKDTGRNAVVTAPARIRRAA